MLVARPVPVFRRSLRDSWRSLVGWVLGFAAAALLYLPLYPSIAGDGQLSEIVNNLPPELVDTLGFRDIATGAGYAHSTVFGLIGFVLFTIAAINWGSAAIAGAEESGRLELELAHGLGRGSYALQAALGILVRLLILGAVLVALVLSLNGPSQLGLEAWNVVAATAALVGLGALAASTALAAGALTGRRASATITASAVAVAGYVVNALANTSEDFEPFRVASPYAWAYQNEPLRNGADWAGLGLLCGASAVLTLVAVVALRRRDITG